MAPSGRWAELLRRQALAPPLVRLKLRALYPRPVWSPPRQGFAGAEEASGRAWRAPGGTWPLQWLDGRRGGAPQLDGTLGLHLSGSQRAEAPQGLGDT